MSPQHSSMSDEVIRMCKSTPYIIRLLNMHVELPYAIFRCVHQENGWSESTERGKRNG
jgi:hypothetical protein